MNDSPPPSWIVRIPTPIWLITLVLAALASWARLTFRHQGAEIMPSSDAHSALVASGPFRFSRNPMYLGLVIVAIGAALVAGTWLMWLVPVVIFALDNFVIIPHEERSMERTFGDSFAAYRARVRRWI
jgi:protein-S-isoprenylcysteine O-methyltransferase Ste14